MRSPRPTSNRHLQEIGGGKSSQPPAIPLAVLRRAQRTIPGLNTTADTQMGGQLSEQAAANGEAVVEALWFLVQGSRSLAGGLRPDFLEKPCLVLLPLSEYPETIVLPGMRRIGPGGYQPGEMMLTRVEPEITASSLAMGPPVLKTPVLETTVTPDSAMLYKVAFDPATVALSASLPANDINFYTDGLHPSYIIVGG